MKSFGEIKLELTMALLRLHAAEQKDVYLLIGVEKGARFYGNRLKTVLTSEEANLIEKCVSKFFAVSTDICLLIGEFDRRVALPKPGENQGAIVYEYSQRAQELIDRVNQVV